MRCEDPKYRAINCYDCQDKSECSNFLQYLEEQKQFGGSKLCPVKNQSVGPKTPTENL